ncbi:MAG: hypothetical protein PVJ71_03005 [Lysobacterales bacterium]|jgi:phage shock protein A
MSKTIPSLFISLFLALFLAAACADQGDDPEIETSTPDEIQQSADGGKTGSVASEASSLMDQPVDFSSPESAEESLQRIREQVGEKEYQKMQNAIKYLLFYDLSVGQDKEKLYAKLDGKTPNEILAGIKR